MGKKWLIVLGALSICAVLAASFFVRQGLPGLGEKGCTSSYVQAKAQVLEHSPAVFLGDVLEMKVEIRFCSEKIALQRESVENLDVSPFDLKSRSPISERKEKSFTVWEVHYFIQPLNTIPGFSYQANSLEAFYEQEGLLKSTRFSSNEVFVASLVSFAQNITLDIRGLPTASIATDQNLNLTSVAMVAGGGVIALLVLGSLLVLVWRSGRQRKAQDPTSFGLRSRFSAYLEELSTHDSLQKLYFLLRELELEDASLSAEEKDRLSAALAVCERAFDLSSDLEEIRQEVEDQLCDLAQLIMEKTGEVR